MKEKDYLIDVVIPFHKKDFRTIGYCIDGVKKNVAGVRRIIVVSKEKYSGGAEWFDEGLFPFSYSEISEFMGGNNVGWNFQQLLKLYSPLVIPDVLQNILILDSDTVFFRKVSFFEEGLPLYSLGKDVNLNKSEFHQNALIHIKKILPQVAQKLPELFEGNDENYLDRIKIFNGKLNFKNSSDSQRGLISGICHHMIFQRHILEALFAKVEENNSGCKFYEIFLKSTKNCCGVSEYNLYFYFLVSHFPLSYKIRILEYKNTAKFMPLIEKIRRKYDYCSYHSYMRE